MYRVENLKIHENISLHSVSMGWDLNLGTPRPVGRINMCSALSVRDDVPQQYLLTYLLHGAESFLKS
jgi:hypothetical protein